MKKPTRGDRTGVTMLSMIDDIFIIIPVPYISILADEFSMLSAIISSGS
jgi:hypothetical protein